MGLLAWIHLVSPVCALRIPHHKSMWTWRVPIQGEFPAELTKYVLRPYLLGFRPHLVVNRNIQVGGDGHGCMGIYAWAWINAHGCLGLCVVLTPSTLCCSHSS